MEYPLLVMTHREPKERTVALPVRDDGHLRLGVVADTHSTPHPRTREHLLRMAPDAILHAGDIGDLSVLDDLARIARVVAVRGNIDVHAPDLPERLTVDVTSGDTVLLRILLTHIGVDGVRLRAPILSSAKAREASLVVCGHSHIPLIAQDRGVSVFNPGSAGPRRFRLPILFGSIDVTLQGVSLTHFDCETGERWVPRMSA
jgi:uncharacterized protein